MLGQRQKVVHSMHVADVGIQHRHDALPVGCLKKRCRALPPAIICQNA